MSRTPILATITLLLAACGGTDPDEPPPGEPTPGEVVQLELAHHQQPCQGEGRWLCFKTRDAEDAPFQLFYEQIEGFEFVWGHRYVLSVRTEPIANPPRDGSDTRYILEEILEEEVDRTSFELILDPGDLRDGGPADLLLFDVPVACASDDLCRVLQARMDDEPIVVRARAGSEPDEPVTIFRVM